MPFFHIHLIDLDWLHVVDLWNFPRFYRLFLQVLDRSKVANTPGCFGAIECLLWLAPRLAWFIVAKLWWTEWCLVALGQSLASVATVVHRGTGNALAHAMTWCTTTTVLNQFGDTISRSEEKWAHLLFVLCRGFSGLSRSYKDSCQGFKFSLKILVVCQGVKDSSQRIPNSCQGG